MSFCWGDKGRPSNVIRGMSWLSSLKCILLRTPGTHEAGGSAPDEISVPTVDSYEPHTQGHIHRLDQGHKCNKHGTCALILTKHGPKHCIMSRVCQLDLADSVLALPLSELIAVTSLAFSLLPTFLHHVHPLLLSLLLPLFCRHVARHHPSRFIFACPLPMSTTLKDHITSEQAAGWFSDCGYL